MRILILSDVNSSHTRKWVEGLMARNMEVSLFSLTPDKANHFKNSVDSGQLMLKCMSYGTRPNTNLKALYLSAVPAVHRIIKRFRPEIVHAHYASSYGLIGMLACMGKPIPYVISVWGSDVYEFPFLGTSRRKVLSASLNAADAVCSTGKNMSKHTRQFTRTTIHTIGFGIQLDRYPPRTPKKEAVLRFATAKSLAHTYNLASVIEAYKELARLYPDQSMELHLAGDGPLRTELENQAAALPEGKVVFHGYIDPDDMPKFYVDKQVLLNPSLRESFGVSVLEASASGLAVIVSDRDGLPEVVVPDRTGFLLPEPSVEEIRRAMSEFVENPALAETMGKQGRDFVIREYNFERSLDKQIALYNQLA